LEIAFDHVGYPSFETDPGVARSCFRAVAAITPPHEVAQAMNNALAQELLDRLW